jgi:hypothetical protein
MKDNKDLRINALAYIAEELNVRIAKAIEFCEDATPGSCAYDCYLLHMIARTLRGEDTDETS